MRTSLKIRETFPIQESEETDSTFNPTPEEEFTDACQGLPPTMTGGSPGGWVRSPSPAPHLSTMWVTRLAGERLYSPFRRFLRGRSAYFIARARIS